MLLAGILPGSLVRGTHDRMGIFSSVIILVTPITLSTAESRTRRLRGVQASTRHNIFTTMYCFPVGVFVFFVANRWVRCHLGV